MKRQSLQLASLGFAVVGLLCWFAMFLAGTDVWHDVGRPDLWHLEGPPYSDLRAFTVGFYVLLALLLGNAILTVAGLVTARRARAR